MKSIRVLLARPIKAAFSVPHLSKNKENKWSFAQADALY
jgi:hypothetical protein